MNELKIKEPLEPILYQGVKKIMEERIISASFLTHLQRVVKESPFAFEFLTPLSNQIDGGVSITYTPQDKMLAFLKDFTEQLMSQRKNKAIATNERMSCLILYDDSIHLRSNTPLINSNFELFKEIRQIFEQAELGLDYFVMTVEEYQMVSKDHGYLAAVDLILECSSAPNFRSLESHTYLLNRLNESLILLVDLGRNPKERACLYSYTYGQYTEQNLINSDLASSLYVFLKGRGARAKNGADDSQRFYARWPQFLKEIVETTSYAYYYAYCQSSFELKASLKNYQSQKTVEALGQIQDSHLPFITAAQNVVQFGELITFADSDRQETLKETGTETRTVIKPSLSYRSYGEDGSAQFEL